MLLRAFAATIALLWLDVSAFASDRIRIAVSNPNMPNLTVAVAQAKGFFKEEAIDAEIIRMNPNVAITALSTGDVDYCQLFGAVVGGAIAGLPVRIVAGFLDNWPMTLIAQPEYKSLKDLKGKTLGISSFGATPDVGARLMLKQRESIQKKTSKCSLWDPTRRGSPRSNSGSWMWWSFHRPPTLRWKSKAIRYWPVPMSFSVFPTSASVLI